MQRIVRRVHKMRFAETVRKEESRGFSHLKKMFECTGLPVMEPFVKTASEEQKGKSKNERLAMEKGICLKQGVVLPEKIVLCDDTMTTGATFRGALRALENYRGRAEIYAVSLNRRWH